MGDNEKLDDEKMIAVELSHHYANFVAPLLVLSRRGKRVDGLTGIAKETTSENKEGFLEGLRTAMGRDFPEYKGVANSGLQDVHDMASVLDWGRMDSLDKITRKYRELIPEGLL
jgi:hypothetical protein